MPSLILRTANRWLVPLLLLFSIFLLLRGHDDPGGGFVGGLVAATAFALYGISEDSKTATTALRLAPQRFIATGLLFAVMSGIIPLLVGDPFLTGIWDDRELPAIGKLGTPFFFDIGVYFLVIGITTLIVFTLMEAEETSTLPLERKDN